MSTDHLCPKCYNSNYVINESDLEFLALAGDVSQAIITTGITKKTDLTLTCSSCGYQYNSSDQERKQDKVRAARLALMATQNGSQLKVAMIYGIIGALTALTAYQFFLANQTIFGFIFSVAAFALLGIAITGVIFTSKKK